MTTHTTALAVLIVENDPADAALVVESLRQGGFTPDAHVVATRDAFTAALDTAQFDVVLADYRLHGWTGMDALDLLRARELETPLILVTGTLGDERAVECVKRGVTDYVLKESLARLPAVVQRAVDEHAARTVLARAETRVKAAEASARERDQRLTQLADSISDVLYLMHVDFSATLFINKAYEDAWGRTRESLYEQPSSFLDGIDPEDRPAVAETIARVQRGEEPGPIDFRVIRPDGTKRWITSRAMPVRDAAGVVRQISGVAMDVTEQRLLQEQFRQAQKMEAVGRLAGGVAHDFNNLLTVISSYADLIVEGLSPNDPRQADVEEITKASKAAASLTRQLLAFSRREVISPRNVDLQEVLRSTSKMLRRVIGEDIDLSISLGDDLLTVNVDPGQFEQVIMNLVVNARDAMPTGGKLTIEARRAELDDAYARDHWPAIAGTFAMVAVSDTGSGMDAATRMRIFEPFFTTKEAGKGTGLGLATVYGIVKQSNGFVWVYSEPGEGSTFKVYLPLVSEAAQSSATAGPLPPVGGTETILLVEDAEPVRSAVRRIAQGLGYKVLEASTPFAAIDIASKATERIDLLLTDIVMPEMSGRELAERFAAMAPGAKIVFMSGYTDDAVIRHGLLSSQMAFLQKPFSTEQIARKLREVLDRKPT